MRSSKPNTVKIKNTGEVTKAVASSVIALTLFYFTWWLNYNHIGNPVLYSLLVLGEIYHVWQAIAYLITIPEVPKIRYRNPQKFYPVDVFITVAGEPVDVVEQTLKAAVSMDYPNFNVYILNDGKSANKDNWEEIDELALKYQATPITRSKNVGAKAGNINNALKHTHSPFIAVFDSDHKPEKNFLLRTMGYFEEDPKLALVQTPQYYENKDENDLTQAAWEQQELFFGPICVGKNKFNSTFWCGTNAIVRRSAINSIGGVPENNIAEDFLASLFMHEKGWRTLYVPEILAKGLAPHNLGDYVNQQYRWARGSLEVIFKYNPLFRKGLSRMQKFQYLYSSGYYLTGLIVLIDAIVPLVVLNYNILPVKATTSDFMIFFFPFIFSTLYILMTSTNNRITFRAIQMSVSSFFIFFQAMLSTIFGIKTKFKVTSKSKETGNYLKFTIPHILYTIVAIISVVRALIMQGFIPSVVTNASWALFNVVFFVGYLRVAYPWATLLKYLGAEESAKDVEKVLNISNKKYAFTYAESEGETKETLSDNEEESYER